MTVNFEIHEHYAIRQNGRHIDIHNNFDLIDLKFECDNRELTLRFIKGHGDWIGQDELKSLTLIHSNVTFLVVNYDNKECEFPNDDRTVSDITFFPSSDRQTNNAVTLQETPDEGDDIIYSFQSDFFVRVCCDKIKLIVEE